MFKSGVDLATKNHLYSPTLLIFPDGTISFLPMLMPLSRLPAVGHMQNLSDTELVVGDSDVTSSANYVQSSIIRLDSWSA